MHIFLAIKIFITSALKLCMQETPYVTHMSDALMNICIKVKMLKIYWERYNTLYFSSLISHQGFVMDLIAYKYFSLISEGQSILNRKLANAPKALRQVYRVFSIKLCSIIVGVNLVGIRYVYG